MVMSLNQLVGITVSLILVAIFFPLALQFINDMNTTALSNLDPSILTLLQTVVPILAVIGVALSYVSYIRD